MAKPVLKVKKDKNGKNCATVPCIEMLSYVYEKNLPLPDKSFNEIIKDLQEETKKVFAKTKPRPKAPTSNSFNNCNGRWAEYVFGAYVWNYLADKNATNKQNNDPIRFVYVKLPTNDSKMDAWISLLKKEQYDTLIEFERDDTDKQVKAAGHKAFRLCSSNPDSVILKFEENDYIQYGLDSMKTIDNLSGANIKMMDSVFSKLAGKVTIEENLKCFLSIKNSIRPDRRYQFVHEGDDVKAIIMLLCTRLQLNVGNISDFCQKRFYAFSLNGFNGADENCMETATTACISSPVMGLIWCVDKLFSCLTPEEIKNDMDVIMI
ncbi:hypothetical protein E5329_17745 [Petralouisia muris]|jgi:aryl carrier-like protein|uniref:Uncharacterized protein n=1 Tax=Petralouisia muris TaxID=3032872 RepID=A0AC61RTA2_9FIRM|nr:Cfr10I/Bse634I family restriction endonuclease [Petralouisia muris]TGY93603.1 hypothetical protein E5329_17745 [Petralouisia muris]